MRLEFEVNNSKFTASNIYNDRYLNLFDTYKYNIGKSTE